MRAQPQAEANQLYVVPSRPDVLLEIEPAKPWIPDATYMAICIGCDVKCLFKTIKLFIRFRIAEGPHEGIELFRAYRAGGKILPGTGPGSGPRPKLKRRSDAFEMVCRILSLPANTKAHRVSLRELEGKLCRIETRTVTHDSKQQTLKEPYSVVKDILNIEAG